jgi:hypothetical protein
LPAESNLILSDKIQLFIDWLESETDFGDWHSNVKTEVHKKLIECMTITERLKEQNMTFGEAVESLKGGMRVSRSGWNGKNMFLFLVTDWSIGNSPTYTIPVVPLLPFIAMKTADNKIVPWLASQTDVLATDWDVVN